MAICVIGLGCGSDINRGIDERSPLYLAVDRGDIPEAQQLLEGDANPNDEWLHEPVLFAAAGNDDVRMVNLLIRYGADVRKVAEDNWTVLFSAAVGGAENVIPTLLENGADPCVVTSFSSDTEGLPSFEGMRASEVARDRGFDGASRILEEAEARCR